MIRKSLNVVLIICLFWSVIVPLSPAQANVLGLPRPGQMLHLSKTFEPLLMSGLKVHANNPLKFDFIMDTGHTGYTADSPQVRLDSEKMIKYFLATLAIPEQDIWVNLSPYEKNRILPNALGQTDMGQDMLMQDYLLKQITASLIYPEKGFGKEFWSQIYTKSQKKFGSMKIPVNAFNKVWIIADQAKIFVHDQTAFVVKAHLKVMLDQDYLAKQKQQGLSASSNINRTVPSQDTLDNDMAQAMREIIIPQIEKEVNEGKNFAKLRQIYHSMILATWYKKVLKQALLNQVYANQRRVSGINLDDDHAKERIYQQYLQAYQKGVFNYIKEDKGLNNQEVVARKYFSGGVLGVKEATITEVSDQDPDLKRFSQRNQAQIVVGADIQAAQGDSAPSRWSQLNVDHQKWLNLVKNIKIEDINMDMFRDYDFRFVKENANLKPEIVFLLGLSWAKMALEKASKSGTTNRNVLIARDARKIEPEIAEALIAAFRYTGLNVVFTGENPNCVTSYSWAVQSQPWLMTVFLTASHVSEPEHKTVRGFKVTQLTADGDGLLSLDKKEIKKTTVKILKDLIRDNKSINQLKSSSEGGFKYRKIEDEAIDFNVAVGLLAKQNKSLYQWAMKLKSSPNPRAEVLKVLKEFKDFKPLAGLRIAIDGANTPSGYVARGIFDRLGAEVSQVNMEVKEIYGLHKSDPSIEENLKDLKKLISENNAHFGMGFDLDGDRGLILLPKEVSSPNPTFAPIAPDNILSLLMKGLKDRWGYNEVGDQLYTIRDVLGTYAVDQSGKADGYHVVKTDAGYVYLKAAKREIEKKKGVVAAYGERSGHTWLHFSGEIENPILVGVLFALLLEPELASNSSAYHFYEQSTKPTLSSPRFQPFYHPHLLETLSKLDSSWQYKVGVNPPQSIIALGRDYTIKKLLEAFPRNKKFGEYEVSEVSSFQDSPEDEGLYRYIDIHFSRRGQYAGRIVVRASSNDPTFVMSFESPIDANDTQATQAKSNMQFIVAQVIGYLRKEKLGIFTLDEMKENMPYLNEMMINKFYNKSNLSGIADVVAANNAQIVFTQSQESDEPDAEFTRGGIDLNAANMAMTIEGQATTLPVDEKVLSQWYKGNWDKVYPVITYIQPLPSLSVYLSEMK